MFLNVPTYSPPAPPPEKLPALRSAEQRRRILAVKVPLFEQLNVVVAGVAPILVVSTITALVLHDRPSAELKCT